MLQGLSFGRSRVGYLLSCLLIVLLGHLALLWAEQFLSRRDYSRIPDPNLRVTYCMMSAVQPHEKHTIAQSLTRPPDPRLFSAVLPEALSGEVTEHKRAALRALRERDELRRRSLRVAQRAGSECGLEQSGLRQRAAPLEILERWMYYEDGYLFFLIRARQAGPDAAERLYRESRARS